MERQIRTLENAKDIIQPFHIELVKCIQKGFDSYLEIKKFVNDKQVVDFEKRTKAGIVHDHIKANILESFSETPSIKIGTFNRVFGVNIDNKLFIRFKKMDKNFKISNNLTKQHKNYMRQHDIDGFPEKPTFLFAGYIPDENWLNINGIYLACWNGDNLEWYDEAGNYSYEQLSIQLDNNSKEVHKIVESKYKLKETKIINLNK